MEENFELHSVNSTNGSVKNLDKTKVGVKVSNTSITFSTETSSKDDRIHSTELCDVMKYFNG
jgi:hypothetical protein